jgi:uncharacterized membrane protein YqiK
MVEVASIPELESHLQVDRGELVKIKAEQTKPNIDAASLAAGRAAFRAKYEEAQRAKAQEAQHQAEMRERAAQRLAAERERERKQQEQEQKQVRQVKRDRGGPDLGR